MEETRPTESGVDPNVLAGMTPEGRDRVRRMFESSDMIHTLTFEGYDGPLEMPKARLGQRISAFLLRR